MLKLNSLNALCSIGVCNLHIDAWKRVHMAISGIMESDIPRLCELLMVSYRAGASVVSLLEKVKLAATWRYHPKSYSEAQYQLGYLLYKIGRRAAADLAYTTLGTPSVNTAKWHISTNPIVSSASFLTQAELLYNLNACYPGSTQIATGSVIKGMTLQIDKIKIQEHLRWDPKSNQILGVCQEHGGQCSLEFCSMNQADELLGCLQKNIVHLATEVSHCDVHQIKIRKYLPPKKYRQQLSVRRYFQRIQTTTRPEHSQSLEAVNERQSRTRNTFFVRPSRLRQRKHRGKVLESII